MSATKTSVLLQCLRRRRLPPETFISDISVELPSRKIVRLALVRQSRDRKLAAIRLGPGAQPLLGMAMRPPSVSEELSSKDYHSLKRRLGHYGIAHLLGFTEANQITSQLLV